MIWHFISWIKQEKWSFSRIRLLHSVLCFGTSSDLFFTLYDSMKVFLTLFIAKMTFFTPSLPFLAGVLPLLISTLDIGWSIKKHSIKVKKKWTKKWRWPCRELKTFFKKIFFSFWFIQLIWPFKCSILTILTLTKCLQILLKDSILSVISIAKNFLL